VRPGLLKPFQRFEQIEARAGDHARGARVRPLGLVHRDGLLLGPSLQLPVLLARAVGDHGVEPGAEQAAALECSDLAGHLEQRVLGGFLGVLPVRQEPAAAPQDLRPDLPQKRVERGLVTGCRADGQVLDLGGQPHNVSLAGATLVELGQ
jgi:hypothetical protein